VQEKLRKTSPEKSRGGIESRADAGRRRIPAGFGERGRKTALEESREILNAREALGGKNIRLFSNIPTCETAEA